MPRSTNVGRDRTQLPAASDTRRRLKRASAYEQTSAHEKIALSSADWNVFYRALIDPPEPNRKLKAAARRYRERFGG
jgi:uncharacterized protein (DUF1778 family)